MIYAISYLLIGLVVALLTALVQGRREATEEEIVSRRLMLGVYLLIALAWPITVIAFAYGLLAHLKTGTPESDQTI